MKPELYPVEELKKLFARQTIATMSEMKQALGTDISVTVFRKLKELSYHTSYSHGGRYYTLDRMVQFDERGLWYFHSVCFSRHGTLLATLEYFVNHSKGGYFVSELQEVLQVGSKEALLKLVKQGRISREKMGGLYLYCSSEATVNKQQLLTRRVQQGYETPPMESECIRDELKAAIILFYSLLDEKQRRLYAGLESLKWGHGGDRMIAELIGMDVGTVARGRQELLEQDVEAHRIRKRGGGRKSVEKKRRRS